MSLWLLCNHFQSRPGCQLTRNYAWSYNLSSSPTGEWETKCLLPCSLYTFPSLNCKIEWRELYSPCTWLLELVIFVSSWSTLDACVVFCDLFTCRPVLLLLGQRSYRFTGCIPWKECREEFRDVYWRERGFILYSRKSTLLNMAILKYLIPSSLKCVLIISSKAKCTRLESLYYISTYSNILKDLDSAELSLWDVFSLLCDYLSSFRMCKNRFTLKILSRERAQMLWESIFIELQETKIFVCAVYVCHPCATIKAVFLVHPIKKLSIQSKAFDRNKCNVCLC